MPVKAKKNTPNVSAKAKSKGKTKILPKKEISIPRLKHQNINPKKLLTLSDKKNDFMKSFYKKIENYIFNELYLEGKENIVLAVSGGVDSIVMLDVFANLSKKYYFKIHVAHFNHNLRGLSSTEDAEFVRKTAKTYNIPFEFGEGNVKQYAKKNMLSVENAGRNLRYKFFERTAKTLNANFVATAHTSDDLAETFLINLIRGSGLTGLSGIPAKRLLCKKIFMFRPFLSVTKSEILEYAKLRKLTWHEDGTNSILLYTRNKVRHELIPKLKEEYSPAIVEILNRTANLINGADKYIHEKIKKLLKNIVSEKTSDRFSLKISLLQTLDDFFQGELIQQAITSKYRIHPFSILTIDRILNLMKCPVGSVCEVNKSLIVLRDRDELIFTKRNSSASFNIQIESEGEYKVGNNIIILKKANKKDFSIQNSESRIYNSKVEFFDGDLLPKVLYLRTRESGDTFHALGMKGKMKLSDFLINMKIPLIDKDNIVLLATRSEIVWVCGVRMSDKFKITEKTSNFIKAEIKSEM